MPSAAPTCIASDEASGKGELSFARRIRELVTPQRGQVHADIAEHAERVGESVARIALCQQRDHVHVAFIAQLLLEVSAAMRETSARSSCAK